MTRSTSRGKATDKVRSQSAVAIGAQYQRGGIASLLLSYRHRFAQVAASFFLPVAAFALVIFLNSASRADENPLSSIYRSLDQWGRNIKQQLQDEASPTPSRTRSRLHQSTVKRHGSPSPSPSAARKAKSNDEKPAATQESKTNKDQQPASTPVKQQESKPNSSENENHPASVASLEPSRLKDFDNQPQRVQDLIRSALALTQRDLAYTYGSADPTSGGMDCSGFIYYVLTNAGFKDVPRQSSDQYLWVRKDGDFHAVLSRNANTFELDQLRPGDLMFWSGTYKVDRDVPVTHVMIYLGKEKSNGKPVMVGASDGRSYDGIRRSGVSVFDFKLPNGSPNKNDPDLVSRFEGYSPIPGLRDQIYRVQAATPSPTANLPLKKNKPSPPSMLGNGD